MGGACGVKKMVDLTNNGEAATAFNTSQRLNGSAAHSAFTYQRRALDILANHDPNEPLFVYYACVRETWGFISLENVLDASLTLLEAPHNSRQVSN